MIIGVFLGLVFAGLVACAPTEGVKGVGSGTDEYKKSPCAGCDTIIPQRGDADRVVG
jgi:hypothetical protein